MKHISEDNLLQYALETLSTAQEREEIETHLAECSDCRTALKKIQDDIHVISSVKPLMYNMEVPKQKRRFVKRYAFLKVAALFLFGLFVGLGISGRTDQEIVFISPVYLYQSSPADSLFGYAIPDATQMSQSYYNDSR